MPLQRHPSPLSGSIWFFIVFSILSLIFFLITVFTNIFFFLITVSLIFFFSLSYLSWFFFHVSAFSWLFLISLCRSFHIFSSVLFFVLFSCPPNRNSPRTWSVSSILGLCKDLLSIRHSSHLGQCSMKCSSVSLSSLHPTHTSLFLCQEFSPRFRLFVLALNHTIQMYRVDAYTMCFQNFNPWGETISVINSLNVSTEFFYKC